MDWHLIHEEAVGDRSVRLLSSTNLEGLPVYVVRSAAPFPAGDKATDAVGMLPASGAVTALQESDVFSDVFDLIEEVVGLQLSREEAAIFAKNARVKIS